MRKFWSLILIVLASSMPAFSQTDTPTPDWQTFAPRGESFTVEVPVALKVSGSSDDNKTSRFGNVFDGTYFFIFSDNVKNPFQYNRAMDFVKIYRQTGAIESVSEFETEKFAFQDNEDFYHTVLTAKAKNRIYVFQTVSPSKTDSAVERFFASLKLNDQTVPEIPVSTEETNSKPVDKKISERGKGDASDTGETTPAEIKPTPSPKPGGLTSPLKILSNLRANYTDFARFYQISGKIVLRVTFSANGSIGAVVPLTKQPFGLTAQAIEAAKGIRFEPAMKEGVPYSVSKPVGYSFIIY